MKKIFISLFLVFLMIGLAVAGGVSSPQGMGHSPDISWGYLIMGLFGGLAFFLFGMEMMSEGMKKTAGNQMRSILAALTQNRFFALLAGAFVTMVIQSSSATTAINARTAPVVSRPFFNPFSNIAELIAKYFAMNPGGQLTFALGFGRTA